MQAQIITKPDCPFCVQAKDFMYGLGVTYSEEVLGKDVSWNEKEREKFRTVPQIWVKGKHIGGYEDLVKWAINE